MSDRSKAVAAVLAFILSLFLPVIGLVIGWWKWDAQTGLLLMVGGFIFLFVAGALLLFRIRDLSWLTVSLPYIFGSLYALLPDVIPFSVDDAAVASSGAIFSFILALRKNAQTPKWIFLPLIATGIYTLLVGPLLPGPLDEALVDILAMLLAWIGARQTSSVEDEGEED